MKHNSCHGEVGIVIARHFADLMEELSAVQSPTLPLRRVKSEEQRFRLWAFSIGLYDSTPVSPAEDVVMRYVVDTLAELEDHLSNSMHQLH